MSVYKITFFLGKNHSKLEHILGKPFDEFDKLGHLRNEGISVNYPKYTLYISLSEDVAEQIRNDGFKVEKI